MDSEHKDTPRKMTMVKAIVKQSNTEQECVQKLLDEGIIVSFAQGRRLWYGLKDKVDNENSQIHS